MFIQLIVSALFCQSLLFGQTAPITLKQLKGTPVKKTISFRQALSQALEKSPQMEQIKGQNLQQRTLVKQARAVYLPQVDLSGGYTYNWVDNKLLLSSKEQLLQQSTLYGSIANLLEQTLPSLQDPAQTALTQNQIQEMRAASAALQATEPQAFSLQPQSLFSGRLSLTQPIINLKYMLMIQMASVGDQIISYTYEFQKDAFLLQIGHLYYDVIQAQKIAQLAKHQQERLEKTLADQKVRYQLGLIRRSELNQIQISTLQAAKQAAQAGLQYQSALAFLGDQIGETSEFQIENSHWVMPLENEKTLEDLLKNAKVQRKDLLAQKLNLKVAEKTKQSIYAEWMPSLYGNLTGQYSNAQKGKEWNGSVGLQLNVNLLDGFGRFAKIQESTGKIYEEKAKLKEAEINLESSIQGQIEDIKLQKNTADKAGEILDLQKQVYMESKMSFEQGLINSTELIASHQDLLSAETEVIKAQTELYKKRLTFAFLTGQLNLVL